MRTKKNHTKPNTYSFTLVLVGLKDLTDKLNNDLFEAGCDDALLGSRDGMVFLDFDRKALSFKSALLSANGDVNRAGYQVAQVDFRDSRGRK